MPQTGIALPSADPGTRKFQAWDFCRLPNGRLLVACTPHVDAWTDATNGRYREHRLRVYVYDDAFTPEPVSYTEIESSWCNAVAIDSDSAGRVHLLYFFWDILEPAGQKTKIIYRMSPDGGASWTSAVVVPHVGVTYLTPAPLVGAGDQRSLFGRINSRTGLFHVIFRGSGAGGDPNMAFMVGSPDGAGGWSWSNAVDINTPGQGDVYEIQTTLAGELRRFPRNNRISNISGAAAFDQESRGTTNLSGGTAVTGLVDEITGTWLLMLARTRASMGLAGTGVVFNWAVRTLDNTGAWVPPSPTTSGPSLVFPDGYIEGYGITEPPGATTYLPGSGRLRRRSDGVYEFLYSRYSDGNLVFARCRQLPSTALSPSNPGTWNH